MRYRSQELTPASVPVVFSFQKYGIDLRGDDSAVYFPLATINDLYSDLYYHIAGYNGEKVIVVTDNQKSTLAKLEPEQSLRLITAESRSADMADYSYGQLCFVVDHFYGMPGRSPLEQAIRKDGLDKALDSAENGATIKKLLKSTDMQEYLFGMDCLQMLLHDGGVEPTHVIDTKSQGYTGFYDVAAISKIINGGSSAEGDMATVSAKGLYAESDLTLDVTKTADGSIKLYDSKRNIYTVNAAKIPEVANDAEANAIVNDPQKLTAALQGAVSTYARGGQLTGYILKSIRIDEMTSPATGQSLMPAADAPLASFGVVMMYKGTQTVHLWDYMASGVTDSPIALDNLEAQKRMIPTDGVLLTIAAGRSDRRADRWGPKPCPRMPLNCWHTAPVAPATWSISPSVRPANFLCCAMSSPTSSQRARHNCPAATTKAAHSTSRSPTSWPSA